MANNNTKTVLTFLAGVTAGVIAGILLAPDSGKNTRNKIKEKALGLKDQLGNKAEDGFNKLKKAKDNAFSKINKGVEKANEEIGQAR